MWVLCEITLHYLHGLHSLVLQQSIQLRGTFSQQVLFGSHCCTYKRKRFQSDGENVKNDKWNAHTVIFCG